MKKEYGKRINRVCIDLMNAIQREKVKGQALAYHEKQMQCFAKRIGYDMGSGAMGAFGFLCFCHENGEFELLEEVCRYLENLNDRAKES